MSPASPHMMETSLQAMMQQWLPFTSNKHQATKWLPSTFARAMAPICPPCSWSVLSLCIGPRWLSLERVFAMEKLVDTSGTTAWSQREVWTITHHDAGLLIHFILDSASSFRLLFSSCAHQQRPVSLRFKTKLGLR